MSQFALKLIAMICMLLDHTAKIVLPTWLTARWFGPEVAGWIRTSMISLGHIAFPMFAWFTAEGCRRSSSPEKRMLRLLLFALLSEAQFQYCFYQTISLGTRNTLFTLLLASAAIWAGEALEKHDHFQVFRFVPGLIALVLAWDLKTDYNAWGVFLILLLYYLPDKRSRLVFLGCWITVFRLLWHGWTRSGLIWIQNSPWPYLLEWAGCMLSVPILAAYNGEKGRGSKWLFYWFYPIHLTVLLCVRQALLTHLF